MRLEHVMSHDTVTVRPSDTIVECARTMRMRGASSVLVVDEAERLVGILTERDLTHKVVAEGLACEGLHVSDFMTANPITADPLARVWEGARLMAEHRIRHLPLIRDGRPVGVVSSDDLSGMEAEPRAPRDVIRGLEESSREQTLEVPATVGASDLGEIIPAWY
ncbi:MAG: CBS domain-containing protein [Actinomycetota bacterium]